MRILVTNDDGINAPGLKVAIAIANKVAGPKGEVWVVAPAFEQSGVGHCISYTRPMMIARLAERTYAAEGSPADCVLAAIHDVMDGAKPDLVISGVNSGNNAAENTLYSGTLGGAMEAALQGVKAIALSQFLGPRTRDLANPFDAAAEFGAGVVGDLLEKGLWDGMGYRLFYNVNFPPIGSGDVKGTRITKQGFRGEGLFTAEATISPTGRRFLWIKGGPQHLRTEDGSDVAANLDDYISITPLRADLTAHDAVETLRARFTS